MHIQSFSACLQVLLRVGAGNFKPFPSTTPQTTMKKHLLPAIMFSATLLPAAAFATPCDTTTDKLYGTPLIYSIAKGNTANVSCLLKNGADVNASDSDGHTALTSAAARGNTEIVKLLVEKGANVNAAGVAGGTSAPALIQLAANERLPDGEMLEIVKLLVENSANVNAGAKGGETALMLAAAGGKTETAKFLIGKGADVNAAAKGGETALMLAEMGGHSEIANILRAAGARK